jgi:hypothetical protein
MKSRFVVYSPGSLEDGAGGFKRKREFSTRKEAVSWASKQHGVMGGGYGSGWCVEKETVNDDGTYSYETVWDKI